MASDLVERLRAFASGKRGALATKDISDAADLIESQAATISEQAKRIEEVEKERDEAVNWNALVDKHGGLDDLDALARQWVEQDGIRKVRNAAASVFAKWANEQQMSRFREYMDNTMAMAFVEGAIVGVRATGAGRVEAPYILPPAALNAAGRHCDIQAFMHAWRSVWKVLEAAAQEKSDG